MAVDLKQLNQRLGNLESERIAVMLELLEPRLSEICDEMRAMKAAQEKAAASGDGLLKKNELADKLQVSISTVNKLQAQGMPSVKCLNSVRYDWIEVLEWLKVDRKKCDDRRLRMVA